MLRADLDDGAAVGEPVDDGPAQARIVTVLVHPEKDSVEAIATLSRSSRSVRTWRMPHQAG
ncbi:hypothetical protein [Micromonospora echinaurantiaca]|uniref:hypothetical protein n=1 Tax=Micromonospora echinaurantiaca TaxID=47857 RepID=UPI0012FD1F1B|nr:hypothetical protein [Micromonospora echinaurantiaca]